MRTGKREGKSEVLNGIPILLGLLLFGVLIGTFLFKTASDKQLGYLKQITDDFISSRQSGSFFTNFSSSLFSNGAFLITAFLVGYFTFGKPIAILIPVFKGLGLGISITDIFARYGLGGYKIALIFIIPSAVISSLAVAFACREAGRNSSKIFSYICGKNDEEKTQDDKISLGSYVIKFAAFFILAAVGAVCDGLISYFFGGLL